MTWVLQLKYVGRQFSMCFWYFYMSFEASLRAWLVKNLPAVQKTPGLIPASRRSPGEGIGYQLQYSWALLVAQLAKYPPAMWETWVWYLRWEDSPGQGKSYPLQYSGLENSRVSNSLSDFHFHFVCPRKSKGMCRNSTLCFHELFPSVLIPSGILNL